MAHPNWYEGTQGAAQGLQQGVQIAAQNQLEEMKDKRAENLARMTFNWHAAHDTAMQTRSFEHDTRIEQMRDELQGKQITANMNLQNSNQNAYFERMEAARKADQARVDSQNDSRERIATERERGETRTQMLHDNLAHEQRIEALQKQIAETVKGKPMLSMIDDPTQQHMAMAKDPDVGPMLDQLIQSQNEKSQSILAYSKRLAQLGDPDFQGKQASDLPTASQAAMTPEQRHNAASPPAPGVGPVNFDPNSSDNTGAAVLPGAPGGAVPGPLQTPPNFVPGASAAGMPPTVGPPRAPTTSNLGPLQMPPQLIPGGIGGSQQSQLIPSSQ